MTHWKYMKRGWSNFFFLLKSSWCKTMLRYCTCQVECNESEIYLATRVQQGEAEALTHLTIVCHISHSLFLFIYLHYNVLIQYGFVTLANSMTNFYLIKNGPKLGNSTQPWNLSTASVSSLTFTSEPWSECRLCPEEGSRSNNCPSLYAATTVRFRTKDTVLPGSGADLSCTLL